MNNELDLQYDRLLGEGSYGKVFLVKQQNGEKFAVKEIELSKCDDTGREQAHGEAHLLSRLKHDNILHYVESVICDDCLYIVTEFCEGGDLEDYLMLLTKKTLTTPESLISEWILQLGEALNYLHDQKILHRDMKTKNIFLKEDLTVKLGDLGIAKVLDLNQSKADTFIGTPSYMSPELFTGKSYNHKTDIWGLGCCVYEMMTLKRAFQGRALWTLIREIKNGRNLEMPDTYSLEIRTLVLDMMAQQPEDRPSARDIVNNDLLLYHRGAAKQHRLNGMPVPGQKVEKKKPASGGGGSAGSGSLRQVLQQMNKSEEERFRSTIETVCEKINTLRLTGEGCQEEYNTFVYKGDSDDEDELEAEGTVLDNSLLKQYTEQLETFVFKGFDRPVEESDSDYFTGGSLGKESKVKPDKEDEYGDEDEVSKTLLRQYSQTLAADEEDEGTIVKSEVKVDGPGVRPKSEGQNPEVKVKTENKKTKVKVKDKDKNSTLGHLESDEEDNFDETINLKSVSKYQYKGLKDTFAIRPDKRWKRSHSEPSEWFSPPSKTETELFNRSLQSENEERKIRSSKTSGKSKSVSISLDSTGTLNGSRTKTEDPRLLQTFEGQSLTSQSRPAKTPVCARIEQTVKHRSELDRQKSPKKAFTDIKKNEIGSRAVKDDVPDLHVKDVMSHLRDNISPYASVDSQSETIRSQGSDDVFLGQDPGKGKKKKDSYLKKQSEARKKSADASVTKDGASSGENDVKLFTHAQTARFSKSMDDNRHTSKENGNQSMQDILSQLHRGSNEHDRSGQILFIQHELSKGVGYDNLRQLLDVMSLVTDEQEIHAHFEAILGPRLFEQYRLHLNILRRLEQHNILTLESL